MLKGIPASQGIAVGKVRRIERPVLHILRTQSDPEKELQRLSKAYAETISDIEKIRSIAAERLSPKEAAIFEMHLLLIRDASFTGAVERIIREERVNAEAAVRDTADKMIQEFENMDDPYFRERSADVRDVVFRLVCHLSGQELPDVKLIDEPCIVISRDLTPSDTGSANDT